MNSVDKKINLNTIIEKMNKKFGEDNLSELEISRYLYIELGKILRYKMDYLTMHKRKQEDIYFTVIDDFDDIRTNAWICVQMSDMYVELLRRVGIKASTERDVKSQIDYILPHKYTVINLKDGKKIVADLIYDLPFIQLGMKTKHFATNEEDGHKDLLSEEELKYIDDKIGYTFRISENEKTYTEAFLEMIKNELNDPEKMKDYVKNVYNGEKYKKENLIKYKLDLICKFFGLEKMGFYEGSRILANFYNDFFSDTERKKLSFVLFRKEPYLGHKSGNVEEVACYCFKKDERSCDYYIYEESKGMECISREEMKEKIKSYERVGAKNFNESEYGDDIF